ncbi:hypothetical protein Kpol_1043p73 [Vanderwaltozyma polyspora DSM 70294]|uniref:PIN domain-containing protein n=1 Tax=Vanderwaltozyma polyspora (strain ATCC 22028 / DSM 70294 / BCRC 21397 / CBS 2163 / NBRC 10782 / NRRL Y-8283 / UCD 57-17) TaxID=436907 RepID=A7TIU0_VANPO|nr:uncharacterized protein Kpol_1043p73 [Vanderwaltozyma polyspora DSM 70294]EDO17882.1 hypothetical protein Kpol_1043p73 [Vanderwaltozyma polyspora DSM 70294]
MSIPLPNLNLRRDEGQDLSASQSNEQISLNIRNERLRKNNIQDLRDQTKQMNLQSTNQNTKNLGQKRHGSSSYYITPNYIKKRVAKNSYNSATGNFLDSGSNGGGDISNQTSLQNTPLASPKPSIAKNNIINTSTTPQPTYITQDSMTSPFVLNSNLPSNLDIVSNENLEDSIRKDQDFSQINQAIKDKMMRPLSVRNDSFVYQVSNFPSPENTEPHLHTFEKNTSIQNYSSNDNIVPDNDMDIGNENANNESNDSNNNNNNNDFNGESGNNGTVEDFNDMSHNVGGNGDEDKDNKDNGDNNDVPSVSVPPRKSSQALVQKLQDIYKIILKQEVELQERCSQLTNSQTTEIKNLWVIYKLNADLINNYVTFITTALFPSQSKSDLLIGEEIVDIYKIERRLWVYGTITFLDVLKNFSNFMDPEVCCQFITHVFISISSMLDDIPQKYAIPWLQKLGDLSRMAVALFPSGFIDWKLSAERWYMAAMEYSYGYGKLYYHMSTVQQNTLEAFVNLGKSVFCQNTFVPSQQYLQLVIDNIYQRAFADRNSSSNSRNCQLLVDYLKHSEVMLLPNFMESPDLQQVVLLYFMEKFGIDYNNNNVKMFQPRQMFIQNNDQLKFYFRHANAFAEAQILQLVGYGNPKNPFALLFSLPKYLKERRDKKEKRKPKNQIVGEDGSSTTFSSVSGMEYMVNMETNVFLGSEDFFNNIDKLAINNFMPNSISLWNDSLKYHNFTATKCSMIVLQKFLNGPLMVALPHILPWVYFLISIALQIEKYQDTAMMEFWYAFIKRIFPWNSMVRFLNVLLAYMIDNCWDNSPLNELCDQYGSLNLEELLRNFNANEDLPEVWKCRGSLWFDIIDEKRNSQNCDSYTECGIKDYQFLDFPVDGIEFDENDEIGIKFWKRSVRVIFLFRGIVERFNGFGNLAISYNAPVINRRGLGVNSHLVGYSFKLMAKSDDIMFDDMLVSNFEEIDSNNSDFNAIPLLSMIYGENIFEYVGYKRIHADYYSFDKNGDLISTSFYNTWSINQDTGVNGGPLSNNSSSSNAASSDPMNEKELFNKCFDPEYDSVDEFWNKEIYDDIGRKFGMELYEDTYFILDATSWLRHFAHVYKIATNSILKFSICLTTFQELRFLRKSKDENVVEAATRAIITLRQLFSEGKLLPLRFTGNVATHIEEHLEFEEQITWRSHVDEFVIEAVIKAETKRKEQEMHNMKGFQIVLVTDDSNMKNKALEKGSKTFSTRFVFAISNYLRTIDESKRQLAIN